MLPPSVARALCSRPSSSQAYSARSLLKASSISCIYSPNSRPPFRHQRRNSSSSKPSRPADDGSATPGPQNSTQSSASSSASTSSARVGRRRAPKANNGTEASSAVTSRSKDEAVKVDTVNVPSVPSTHHIHPADVAVSAFFSLHRPISVTLPVPTNSSPAAFNSIFTPRTNINHAPNTVIDTLSSTIQTLDVNAPHHAGTHRVVVVQPSNSTSAHEEQQAARAAQAHAADSPLKFPSHLLNSNYKPFTPPPVPTPSSQFLESDIEQTEEGGQSLSLSGPSQRKSYTTVLTIVETTDSTTGEKSFTAQTSPVMSQDLQPGETAGENNIQVPFTVQDQDGVVYQDQDPSNSQGDFGFPAQGPNMAYIERLRRRGGAMESDYHAISVKRIRRLKMKKHKLKKLRRRTRLERRKLDR